MFRFGVNLVPPYVSPPGPIFHRWLPDGENDSLRLPTKHPDTTLLVWFERCGTTRSVPGWLDEIEFHPDAREIDPAVMDTQGALLAGALNGELTIRDISETEWAPVIENQKGVEYAKLGKQTLKEHLLPPLKRFTEVLRVDYGQYWVELPKWDSRRLSLGAFCKEWGMRWSIDGKKWEAFIPDEAVHKVSAKVTSGFSRYIGRDDWGEVTRRAESLDSSVAFQFLCRSREFADKMEIRLATIECAIAAEICVQEVINRRDGRPLLKAFWKLPARERVAVLALMLPEVGQATLVEAVAVFEHRNRIVHEGWEPGESELSRVNQSVESLTVVVGLLLGRPAIRIVSAFPMNAWAEDEVWAKEYENEVAPLSSGCGDEPDEGS